MSKDGLLVVSNQVNTDATGAGPVGKDVDEIIVGPTVLSVHVEMLSRPMCV